jgi:Bacterial Ig domain
MKTRIDLSLIKSYVAAAISLLTTAAMGQTWNLRTDWSNTQNPNGVWSYRAGDLVLPAQLNHESSFCWLSPQFAWARSANDNDRAPALYRQSAPFIFECLRVTEIECGDIATHTGDPYGGIGGFPSVFAWTSPITGFVSVTGAVWLGRDVGRSVDWSVKLNGTSLTSGTVYSGDPYSRAMPFDFATGSGGPAALQLIAVVPGDEITFEAAQGNGSPNGDIVGVQFMVTAGPDGPTPTPAPIEPCATTPNSPPVAVDDFYGVDQFGALNEPAPGVLVNDSDPDVSNTLTAALVTGPSHAASFQLHSNGSFSYVPLANYYGPDTFTYQASDGSLSSETATVHITVRQPGSQGFITGGGKFFQAGRKCTFGFVAKVQGNGVQGNLEFQDHNANLDVKSQIVQWVYAPNQVDGYFSGTCKRNGVTGYTFFVQVHDRGQPGSNDDFSIWIYDSGNALVHTSGGLLSGGNIVIHEYAATPTPTPTPTPTSTPTPTPPEWFYDCDGDGWTTSAGFSETAPPCTPCCPTQNPGSGHDCDDNDNLVSGCP